MINITKRKLYLLSARKRALTDYYWTRTDRRYPAFQSRRTELGTRKKTACDPTPLQGPHRRFTTCTHAKLTGTVLGHTCNAKSPTMKPELAGKLAGLEPPVDRPEIKTKATPSSAGRSSITTEIIHQPRAEHRLSLPTTRCFSAAVRPPELRATSTTQPCT